ncbi:MAG: lysophospholipid acyltransferase family protein [Alphaproteobacteria bacterium]
MIVFRSILFNIIFYGGTTIGLTVLCPLLLMPKAMYRWIPHAWSTWVSWVLRTIVGVTYRIEGKEYMPKTPVLMAIKHQSAWETIALNHIIKAPAYILKKELTYIFPFGLYLKKAGMIPLDRRGTVASLKNMISLSKKRLEEGYSIIIFPEGTRSAPGTQNPYKKGIYTLYKRLDTPVVPVALNSGVYWPRRTFLKYPGEIVLKFLPPLQPGMEEKEFMSALEKSIETASKGLLH